MNFTPCSRNSISGARADQPAAFATFATFAAALLATFDDGFDSRILDQPGGDTVDVPEAARGRSVQFEYRHVGVAIADESRKSVSFAVEQPVAGGVLVEQTAPQSDRLLEPSRGPIVVESQWLVDSAGSKRDRTFRIVEPGGDRPAACVVEQQRRRSGRSGRQISQSIDEDPRMPAFQTASQVAGKPQRQARRLATKKRHSRVVVVA